MDWIHVLNKQIESHKSFVMATIVEKIGGSPREPGTRCFITADGLLGTIGGGELEENVRMDGIECLEKGEGLLKTYTLQKGCAGKVTVFYEYFAPINQLLIFGGGHVGRALSHVMAQTSFRVSVIEERVEYAKQEDFPHGVSILKQDYLEAARQITTDSNNTFIVIATYSHEKDEALLAQLINKPYKYLGVIGSKRKAAALKKKMRQLGVSDTLVEGVRCPIGDPTIKGRLPKEIAISISAQILSL